MDDPDVSKNTIMTNLMSNITNQEIIKVSEPFAGAEDSNGRKSGQE